MRIKQIVQEAAIEGELLPRSGTPKADSLGRFFANEAIKRFGGTANPTYEPEARAKAMAGNFYKAMLNAIDDEFKMRKMKSANNRKPTSTQA